MALNGLKFLKDYTYHTKTRDFKKIVLFQNYKFSIDWLNKVLMYPKFVLNHIRTEKNSYEFRLEKFNWFLRISICVYDAHQINC